MTSTPANPVTGLPYSLVDVDERERPLRVRGADAGEWRLWVQRNAWLLSLATMAPGIVLLVYTVTGNLAFAASATAIATLTPAAVFWRRTRGLP